MLAAYFYTRMYADPAALVVLPHQRWQDWKQVNDRISLQVAVLPVDKFLPEDPGTEQTIRLKALFNDFKEFNQGVGSTSAVASFHRQIPASPSLSEFVCSTSREAWPTSPKS